MTSLIDKDSLSIVNKFLDGTEKHDRLVEEFKRKKSRFIVECNNCKRATTYFDFCECCCNVICVECSKTEDERLCCDDHECFKLYEKKHCG